MVGQSECPAQQFSLHAIRLIEQTTPSTAVSLSIVDMHTRQTDQSWIQRSPAPGEHLTRFPHFALPFRAQRLLWQAVGLHSLFARVTVSSHA